jgi:hypothetical protein
VKQQKRNKLSTNFSPQPYTVTAIKGSKVVAENKDHRITRNSSFFRKFHKEKRMAEECRKCGKLNHFARQCRSSKPDNEVPNQYPESNRRGNKIRPVVGPPDNQSESSSSDESSYCYAVKTTAKNNPTTKVTINKHQVKFTVDTGSTINVIDQATFKQLGPITLRKTRIKAYPFNGTVPVKMKGKFQTTVESRKKITVATIYVTEADGGCLLSANTAEDLGLITLHLNHIKVTKPNSQAAQQGNIPDKGVQRIVNKHSSVFQGQGKLRNKQIELIIDEAVKPVAQKQRRIPFHLREKVERELSKLEHDDIIEPVPDTEETEWISPLVIVPKKDDKIRLCVDMRAANNAIKRVRHPIPTVKDVSLELNGAKFFTKLDLTQAYHQLELSPSSRHITTFVTHTGIYRFKRLNYGTNSAAEIFQHTLQQVLQGIKGVRNIADDILIFGSTYEEHNTSLEECLQRLEDNGLTLNVGKCLFLKQNLDFFGLVFSKDGVSPDPKQISALANSTTPTTPSEVRSLLGLENFSAQFISNFATITEPLRMLTHKNIPFTWGDEQENAYQTLKTALISKPVMSYFDPGKETVIIVDASPVGLCAILAQRAKGSTKTQTISYGSRALTSTEKRYSQTEKEALAIVWGIEHFHLYLYGAPFTLHTDHKPLELIYANPLSKPPARIERWILRLQQYDFKVVYKVGKDNPADFLSRHPLPGNAKESNIADEYVNFVTVAAVPRALTLSDISKATHEDKDLCTLRAAIETGHWVNNSQLEPYKYIKDEITVDFHNNVLLRGTRILVPSSLRQQVINIAHEGHQGQAKTKALLRESVWFPGMDKAVKETVDSCLACQANLHINPPEPIQSPPMPDRPWEKVKVDFYGPLPSGHYVLVVIDCYSRFPEVETLKSISAKKVIPKLDSIFSRHGIPAQLTSDNGPPFQGHEFNQYMTAMGIKHCTSTPLWPQGNAEAEAFMKPLGKYIRSAHLQKRPWQQELSKFLLTYRQTPHSTTKVPPAQLLFNRNIQGKLPTITPTLIVNRHSEAQANQGQQRDKAKQYADNRRHARPSNIKVGDQVLVKQQKRNKLSTNFSPQPYTVTAIKGSKVVAENKDHRITRNSSFFRKFHKEKRMAEEEDDEMPVARTRGSEVENAGEIQQEEQHDGLRRSTRNCMPVERYGLPVHSSIIP